MKLRHLLLVLLAGSITTAWATEPAPLMLGNLKATQHQTCGKNIDIQIADMQGTDQGRTIIALKNNKTGDIDLFTSSTLTTEHKQYDEYQPVTFDNLSKTFVTKDDSRPSIVWGGATVNLKGMQYSLALGSHVYQCSALSTFEGEVANDLYGDASN